MKRKKRDVLKKLLKTRDRIDEKNKETADYQNQIIRLKEDAKIEVEKKRTQLKNKLLDIRRKAQRKNKLIEQKIQKVRGEMASDLMKANKQGSWKKMQEC